MTMTTIWRVGRLEGGRLATELREAAELLRGGGVVAFPTETVYGLGADARSTAAVGRIFAAKGRPADNPLIVHIADRRQLDELALSPSELAETLMDRFWPGPLTIVLPVREGVLSPLVTAGLATVGVRMPDHRTALALLALAGCPVAAPSANRSGKPSPTLAEHVIEDLDGLIDGVVDDGATGVGLESTVVELAGERTIRILRPGGVTRESLQLAVPGAVIDAASSEAPEEAPRSPGMKYAHYAPEGELELVQGRPEAVVRYIREQAGAAQARGEATGVLAFEERLGLYAADHVYSLGSESELEAAAHRLYAALRGMDAGGVQRIWAEACPERGIGAALMNRMAKAAGHRIVTV
ncbi:L-threonylcarbamoyladenylate synthase [Paenibacillus arenilitoris]|nr:L-threonylcarbamoyladenylate synthase [Paenibacillus arenilitoris]